MTIAEQIKAYYDHDTYVICQRTEYQYEPIPEGEFSSYESASNAVADLSATLGWTDLIIVKRGPDVSALLDECHERGNVTQDWDNETTEFDFADGSVLIVCGSDVNVYGSR